MTDYYQAEALLRETQEAMKRADEFIEKALKASSPASAASDMAESCARLKLKLEEEMVELQKIIDRSGI